MFLGHCDKKQRLVLPATHTRCGLLALGLSQQRSSLSLSAFFFIRFSRLLQGIELLLKLGYVLSISFVGFPVLPEFISSLDGFSSPVVTAAYQF